MLGLVFLFIGFVLFLVEAASGALSDKRPAGGKCRFATRRGRGTSQGREIWRAGKGDGHDFRASPEIRLTNLQRPVSP